MGWARWSARACSRKERYSTSGSAEERGRAGFFRRSGSTSAESGMWLAIVPRATQASLVRPDSWKRLLARVGYKVAFDYAPRAPNLGVCPLQTGGTIRYNFFQPSGFNNM